MKLLLGVGGTDDGLRALERTLTRVRATGDELSVAVLENPSSESTPDEIEDDVRERLAAAGVEARVYRLEGHPGSELIGLAEREGFDRIVLGGGERSPMGKVQVGSIAQFVVVNAPVSVTLIR
ncbi:MAG: universal stress protein [Haloferacaceae archaeon]